MSVVSSDSALTDTLVAIGALSGFPDLSSGTVYYWRVSSKDPHGLISEFTDEVGSFNYRPSVMLESFLGTFVSKGGIVTLEWLTSEEGGNAGFNVYKAALEEGPYTKLNGGLLEGEPVVPAKYVGQLNVVQNKFSYRFSDYDVEAGNIYFYRLEDISLNGYSTFHGPFSVSVPLPSRYALMQNFPNPFNARTVIDFQLPVNERVSIDVYDVLGRRVKTLLDENRNSGYHRIVWDGKDEKGYEVASGIYLCLLISGDFFEVKKMIILR
jgi:hypothetical protein